MQEFEGTFQFKRTHHSKPLAPPKYRMFESFNDFYGYAYDDEFQELTEEVMKDIRMVLRICQDANCEGMDFDILAEIFDKKQLDPRFEYYKFYKSATEKDNINALKFLFSVDDKLMMGGLVELSIENKSYNCLKYLVDAFDLDISRCEKYLDKEDFKQAVEYLNTQG